MVNSHSFHKKLNGCHFPSYFPQTVPWNFEKDIFENGLFWNKKGKEEFKKCLSHDEEITLNFISLSGMEI